MNVVKTGFEVYKDGTEELDLEASIDKISDVMRERSPKKYKLFLRYIKLLKNIFTGMGLDHAYERAQILYLVYFTMRLLDDIIDGDTPNVIAAKERLRIAQQKKDTLAGVTELNKADLFDMLTDELFTISGKLGLKDELALGMERVRSSLQFDAERILYREETGELQKKTRAELEQHFHSLDIIGTIKPTSSTFGLNSEVATKMLEPLGDACRISYTLTDLADDIQHGLLNIPLEDLERFEISDEDLEVMKKKGIQPKEFPDSIKGWCVYMLGEMDHFVAVYKENLQQHNLPLTYTDSKVKEELYNMILKKLVFPLAYLRDTVSAKKTYSTIITDARHHLAAAL